MIAHLDHPNANTTCAACHVIIPFHLRNNIAAVLGSWVLGLVVLFVCLFVCLFRPSINVSYFLVVIIFYVELSL